MSSTTLTLHHFIQVVPVCEQEADVEVVLTLFQSGQHEILVVVNEQQSPLGIIHCRDLMPYVCKRLFGQLTKPREPELSWDALQSSLSLLNLRALMQPLVILPAQMAVKAFLPDLQASYRSSNPAPDYALVDREGKFLGLLNSRGLLNILLPTHQTETDTQTFQEFLYQVLEQLPLPLMLQTAEGIVLCQNFSWHEQIGNFIPPDDASACPLTPEQLQPLETHSQFPVLGKVDYSSKTVQPECLNDSHHLAVQLSRSQLQGFIPQLLNIPEVAVNEPLSDPLKPASKRVWQFFKFPLSIWGDWGQGDKETRRQGSFQPSTFVRAGLPRPYPSTPIWLVLATDVTEQQRLCQELAAKNADLVQLNRLKDEFLACISHELKSPLTAVVGLSSLLKEQKLGELNQRQAHYAELIYHSGRHLMTLVNDLLDLTRLETGQLKLMPVAVNIQAVCQRAYTSTLEKQKGKTEQSLSFCLEIEPGLELLVADELRLHQMLLHLLDNAIKFTQAGGKIGLKVNRWENWLAFTVWDTGIGIPEESQHLIFQKFQQLESPLTRQFEGTGLGLVLTQRLAQAHGGEVSFISKVGQGSEFTLLLPPSPFSGGTRQALSSPQTQRNPLVLIVEAIPRYIENLAEQLNDLGYCVVVARTGTEALEKARQLEPYVIFLNPLLPLLSGWDVLTLLKSDPRLREIPVMITATEADKQQAEQNGVNGFLSLPIEREALHQLLNCQPSPQPKPLTILRLHAASDQAGWIGGIQLSQMHHRLLEADDLDQAEMIARVWKIDVVIVEGTLWEDPLTDLRSLRECEALASLPLITLDAKTTEAANQVEALSVFPCLVPADEQGLHKLLQVIQIAAGMRN